MSTTTIRPVSSAAPLYRAQTNWPPITAAIATIVVVIVSAGLGIAIFLVVEAVMDPSKTWSSDKNAMPDWLLLSGQFIMQIFMALLAWWIAGWFGSERRAALSLAKIPGGVATVVKGYAYLLLISGAFTVFALSFAREDILADLAPMWPLMKGEYWWLMALVAVVGAPLSEEFLFRGFLQSALAKTALGFWGAAIITNSAWTAMHAGYTATGLMDVFLAGLVFSWLLWRTGSLWVPIICHGLYNGLIFLVLSVFDMPEGLVGVPV